MGQGRYRLRDESGQTLILFVLAMPLVLLAMVTLVVDGTNLFVHKRSSQNGADAAVLAIARDLDPYGMPCTVGVGPAFLCWANVQADAVKYAKGNDTPDPAGKTQSSVDHVCASSSDANCVDIQTCPLGAGRAACYVDQSGTTHYDAVKVTVRRSVTPAFGKTVGFSNFKVSASAVAHVVPGGTPLFGFAMSTDCNAIRINGGPNTFPTIWSNGGIGLSGSNLGNHADAILLGSAAGACPDIDPAYLSGPVTRVQQRTCTGGGLSSTCYWPSPLPSYTCTYSAGSWTINKSNWTDTNPRGVYCATDNNGSINISGDNLNLVGYTFVGPGIVLTGQAQNDTFGCTDAVPCSAPGTVFFATSGSIGLNSSASTYAGTAQMYAPNGTITFSGGSTTTFNGVMEAQTLQINGSTTFTGTGALVGNPSVFLDE